MDMTPERWAYTRRYLSDVFGREDESLAALASEAEAAGLPAIAVSADVGRLLRLLVGMSGARRAVEVGTLAGYSAAWIARGLGEGGHLDTLEMSAEHADFAEGALLRLGLSARVTVHRGAALEVLPRLVEQWGPGSVGFVFLDAAKDEYSRYLAALRPALAPGALVVADNILGAGAWWIDDEGRPMRDAVDAFNREVAGDPAFEAAGVPLREGLLLARYRG